MIEACARIDEAIAYIVIMLQPIHGKALPIDLCRNLFFTRTIDHVIILCSNNWFPFPLQHLVKLILNDITNVQQGTLNWKVECSSPIFTSLYSFRKYPNQTTSCDYEPTTYDVHHKWRYVRIDMLQRMAIPNNNVSIGTFITHGLCEQTSFT